MSPKPSASQSEGMRDGDDVTSGGQGCVFTGMKQPACKNRRGKHMNRNTSELVTKVYYRTKEHDMEAKVAEVLRRVDPDMNHFVYPSGFCEVVLSEVSGKCDKDIESTTRPGKLNSSKSTVSTVRKRGHAKASVIPRMEVELDVFMRELMESRQQVDHFYVAMHNGFAALALLHAEDLVYIDIKSNNLMVDDESNVKFIDAGYITDINSEKEREMYHSMHRYWVFPPSASVVHYHKTRDGVPDAEAIFQSYMDRVGHHSDGRAALRMAAAIAGDAFTRPDDIAKFSDAYAATKGDAAKRDAMEKRMMKSNDVYAFALMMVELLATTFLMGNGVRVIQDADGAVNDLLTECLRHNPLERPTAAEARKRIEKALESLKR